MRTPARVAIAVACAAAAIAACGGGADGAQSGVRLVRIGTFDSPTYVAAAPGDGKRLFVVEQAGQIRVLKGRHKLSRPFLDISGLVGFGGEQGLLSMAFASNYRSTGRFYVYFTARNGDIRVMQFRRSSSADRADPNSGHQVIRIPHSEFPNHNGGQVQIGPDHMLYLAPGDGGSEGDPFGRGQSLGTLLGKVLRIDPRPGGGYAIPSGNPFAHRSGTRGEIWAYGLRNPYRFSFDRKTGDMAVADVGQDTWEEVDFARRGRAGANYGWSIFEGFSRFKPGNAPHYVPPVLVTSHSHGNCAIIGGYVVRDRSVPALAGRYLYGDNCNPRIYRTRLAGPNRGKKHDTGLRVRSLSSFGQDGAGHVYLASLEGDVYRLKSK